MPTKISQMPSAAVLTGVELIPMVQGGANVSSTPNAVLAPLTIASYSALRAYAGTAKNFSVTGYLVSASPSQISGQFTMDDSDTTSADNGCTIFVVTSGVNTGKRIKRMYSGAIDVRWAGAKGDGVADDTAAFNVAAAVGKPVFVPEGTWKITTNTNNGSWRVAAGATFTGGGILAGNIVWDVSFGANYIKRLISTYQTVSQLIGLNIEQGLWQTGANSALQFGQTTELFTPSTSIATWTGDLTAVYGSMSHFGSGSTSAIYGGSFEGFNSGPATATTLIVGVNGNAWNGGVAAGYPFQAATNNGSAANLRGVSGFASNRASGVVTNASSLYANSITNTSTGSITNAFGLLVSDQTAGTNNYGVFTGKGLNRFGDTVQIVGNTTLPAATTGSVYMASGFISPTIGRLYVGDGTGWRFEFAKRTGSVDTMLGYFADNGVMVAGAMQGNSPSTSMGYTTGAGGAVVQATSKTTAVTLNKTTGSITMNNAALAAGATAVFNFFNSAINPTSVVALSIGAGFTLGAYTLTAENVQNGACSISVYNHSGGSLSEALVINFALIQGATS